MGKKYNPDAGKSASELLQIRRDKLTALQEAGRDPFRETRYDVDTHAADITDRYDEMEGKIVSVAGRLMSKRGMGKVSFCDLQDKSGRVQLYVRRDLVGEESYAWFKKYDIGDIVGVRGQVFKTEMGQISVRAHEVTLLSKSLTPLPEKFHGLTDKELRYRQRYVDLIMNPEVKDTFVKRSQIIREIRNFLAERDFMEVETPTLVSNAGGAAARPFVTHYNALDVDVKLRISLELYLKRLIVGGLERVYEIGRVYRNEGMDTRHNPEFTLMELYQAYTDYNGMMELTESMFRYLAERVCGSTTITYAGTEIDLGKPFARMTMNEAVRKYAGVDFDQVSTDEEAKAIADAHEIAYEPRHTKGDIINLFFEEYCEKELVQPTFIMDHPLAISPLTKKKPDDPEKVERFELFINTWEMCNAYSELNDPIDQRARFAQQDANAAAGDEEAEHTDEDFLNALELGMPPTGGIGYGIDRLVMLLTDSAGIRDVLLFPTMKPLE
ncbi:MAG: lysine--tRNA ligase [Clostridiales bacterium]|nr:lysine--tRNA ligase [Clostridiales bacterium]